MGWQGAPLLPIAVAFAAGLGLGHAVRIEPLALLAGGVLLLLLGARALAAGRERMAGAAVLACAFLMGLLRSIPVPLPPDHVARRAWTGGVTVEGRLVEEPTRWSPDRARLLLDVEAVLDGAERRPSTGRLLLAIYGELPPLGEGQRLAAEVRLHPPHGFRNPGGFDYPAHLRRNAIHLVGSGRGEGVRPLTADDPPWPVRARRWAVERIRAHLPEFSAALEAGLLLGERTGLGREAEEAFRRAGVYHILAVSGFNVALLASSTFFLLTLLGVPRRLTVVGAGAVLIAFALVVGPHPSVLRATLMGLLVLLAILLERQAQVLNSVALAGLALLLWHPGDLWDPGFQLSFAATLGIVHLAPPATSWLRDRGWPGWLAASLAVSLGAQLAVTPIMLAHFNQLSLIGVAANLVVVPLAGAATTLGSGALAAALVSDTVAGLLFGPLWLLLLLLRSAIRVAAAVPGAMIPLPAPSAAAVAGWSCALALWPLRGTLRGAGGVAMATAALAVALSAWPWIRPADGRLRITFLDVGQGDATLIELPGGQRILVDGGPGGARRFDVGERVLAPFLWNRAIHRIDLVVLSHADLDHSGGLAAVMRRFRVREFWENGRWGPGSEGTLREVERSGASRRLPAAGERVWLGSGLITVLHPPPLGTGAGQAGGNRDSLVLRLDWGAVSLLLPGDLGEPEEGELAARGGPLRTLLLKIAHHGSRSSTGDRFLAAARPTFGVVSVGTRNPFRHPARETLERLETAGVRLFRTDRDGAVVVETDGVTLWITRWGTGVTERFDLDPERARENAKAPEDPGARAGRAGSRSGWVSPRRCARTERGGAPARPDQGACRGRAPSLPGWS